KLSDLIQETLDSVSYIRGLAGEHNRLRLWIAGQCQVKRSAKRDALRTLRFEESGIHEEDAVQRHHRRVGSAAWLCCEARPFSAVPSYNTQKESIGLSLRFRWYSADLHWQRDLSHASPG